MKEVEDLYCRENKATDQLRKRSKFSHGIAQIMVVKVVIL